MRRILLGLVLALASVAEPALAADDKQPVVIQGDDGVTVTGDGSDGTPGSGGGGSGGGSKNPPKSCEGYEAIRSAPAQGPQVGPDGGYYVLERWRCGSGAWSSRSVCIYLCPPGVAAEPAVQPPTQGEIEQRLSRYVVKPLGRFAPPIEGGNAKATVGKRFYYSADPSTYQVISTQPELFPGGWWVTATLAPTTLTFTAGDISSSCDGPGTSGRTKEGRDVADQEGCFVLFDTVPNSRKYEASLVTTWAITVTLTNFGAVSRPSWTVPATSNYTVPLRELQAVVIG